MKLSHEKSYSDTSSSLKDRVINLLEKDPLLTSKHLCKILGLDYKYHGSYVNNIKNRWKHSPEFSRGSKPSNAHYWHGWCYTPKCLSRKNDKTTEQALASGWKPTRSKNRFLMWKDKLGHLKWFETGRINIHVKKPANKGKAMQILANAFYNNGMIFDIRIFEALSNTVRFKGQHYVYDVKERLPYLVIKDFQDSNGIVIRLGDKSHPTAVEIEIEFPDWGEHIENTVLGFERTLKKLLSPKPMPMEKGDPTYVS